MEGATVSRGSATGGVVIDLSSMCSVMAPNGIATVGAGACLGDIDDRLAMDGLAIPAASCPPTAATREQAGSAPLTPEVAGSSPVAPFLPRKTCKTRRLL